MLVILGIVLFILFLFFFLATLAVIIACGAVAGVVFMYLRTTFSYINSVREEVTNPFAKIFTISAVVLIAIVPVAAMAVLIVLAIVGV